MAETPLVVRVAANLDALRANLKEGVNQIETTSTAMRQMATAYDGSRTIAQAGAVMAAIQAVGGVTHLTADEQERANKILQDAIDKYAALGKTAPPGMQALADATKETAHTWEDFVHRFSVSDAISHPLETAKSALGAFAAELGPTGVQLLALAGAGVGVATALFELGAKAEEVGAQIAVMSLTTRIAAPQLSDLKFAFDATGGSIDQLNSLMFMFEQRLVNSSTKVEAGLHVIGLSMKDIEGQPFDEQILRISDAMRAAGGNVNVAAAAFDILGRQGREALPQLMLPLRDLTEKSRELNNTWSVEGTAAAHDFEMAVKLSAAETASAWTQAGRIVAPVTNELTLAWDRMKLALANVVLFGVELGGVLPVVEGWLGKNALAAQTAAVQQGAINKAMSLGATAGISYGDAVKYINEQYAKSTGAGWIEKQQKAIDAMVASLQGEGILLKEIAAAIDRVIAAQGLDEEGKIRVIAAIEKLKKAHQELSPAMEAFLADNAALNPELKKIAAAYAELAVAGEGWRGTIDKIDGSTVELVKAGLDAGVSATALGVIYELNATQIHAIELARKNDIETIKRHETEATAAAALEIRIEAELTRVADEYYKAVNAASHDTLSAQVNDAYLAADAKIAAMQKAKTYSVEAEMQIWATADQTANNIIQKHLELDHHTHAYYVKMADDARIAYAFALVHAKEYTDGRIEQLRREAEATAQNARNWRALENQNHSEAVSGYQAEIDKINAETQALDNARAAKIAFVAAGTAFAVPDLTVTEENKARFIARLKAIEAEYASFPGRAPGGIGITGLNPNDAIGWSQMLQEQIEFLALKKALPGFAGGVLDAPGGWAMVGERGPEPMYVPPHASIYPSGSGAGPGATYITIHVNGTAADVARQVMDEITKTMRASRQWPSA